MLQAAAVLAETRRAKLCSEVRPQSKDAVLPSSRRTPPMNSRAFSSEVDACSRQENATRLRSRADAQRLIASHNNARRGVALECPNTGWPQTRSARQQLRPSEGVAVAARNHAGVKNWTFTGPRGNGQQAKEFESRHSRRLPRAIL
jgi:hypothetical protein